MKIIDYIQQDTIDLYGGTTNLQLAGTPPTLFGANLLEEQPTKMVGLVRREDICLMLAVMFPDVLWVAMGSLFVSESLRPLHSRQVVVMTISDKDLFEEYIEEHDLYDRWNIIEPDADFYCTTLCDLICFGQPFQQPTQEKVKAMRKMYGIPDDGYGAFYEEVGKHGYENAFYRLIIRQLDSLPTAPQKVPQIIQKQRLKPLQPYNDGVIIFPTIEAEHEFINYIV